MSTALITGASSGIGMEIAKVLGAQNNNLILVARRKERLQALADELTSAHGIKVLVLDCDLASREALNGLLARVDVWLNEQSLDLTTLVNNAGTGFWAYFENQQMPSVQRDIDLNIVALTTMTHGFIARAKAHGKPSNILNVASLAGLLPTPKYAVYSGTKSYVVTFSKILNYELSKTNINITCMCPGGVLTEFMDQSGQELIGDTGMMKADHVAQLGVQAMQKGKLIYVPGVLNKLSTLARFLPDPLRGMVVERSMEITVKHAK